MKLKKTISKGLLGVMTFMTLSSAGTMTAKAAPETDDTIFGGYYNGYSSVTTTWRFKTNNTSVYVLNSDSPCGVYVDIKGGTAIKVPGVPNQVTNVQDCNYSGAYTLVGQGQSKKIANTVYEKGLNACRLYLTGTQLNVNLSGWWSPDSI